jgi:Ca2+-binding EF-hand superfamily protein
MTNERFDKLDLDKDGLLSREECNAVAFGRFDRWVMTRVADANEDHSISADEYYDALLAKLSE